MKTIKFKKEWNDIIAKLPEEFRLDVYQAVMAYAFGEPYEDLLTSQISEFAFKLILADLETEKQKSVEISEKRKTAGSRSHSKTEQMLPNATKCYQMLPNDSKSEKNGKCPSIASIEEGVQGLIENILNPTPEEEKERSPKGDTKKEKNKYADEVRLLQAEYDKLVEQYGRDDTDWMIQKLNAYKVSKGKKYKSDYQAILSWVVDRLEEEKRKRAPAQTQNYTNDKYW